PCSEDKCVKACSEGWEANGDHCYFFGDEKKNWTAAEDFCRGEGGHLATVNTNAIKEFVLGGMTSLKEEIHFLLLPTKN
ncbi:MAG: C-type lectin domain-containing protein, partial [Trichodesmium sp. St16_bin2-tuft]|nr:C-type lectin domain-containing protein [Trichodesmium sp. St16_bin2-tuft]